MKSLLEARHPVVFFMNGIGDHFINLPALRALARLLRGRMKLVCGGTSAVCIFDELDVRKMAVVDVCKFIASGRRFDADAIFEQVRRCDAFISLVPWESPSLKRLLDRLRPSRTLGFYPGFDVVLPLDYEKHSAQLAFDVVRHLDPTLRLADFTAPPLYPDEAVHEAGLLLEPLGPFSVLAVHADTISEKMWPAPRFIAVLEEFLRRHTEFFALVVGSTPQKFDVGACADRIIPCHGIALATSLNLVSRADLFLGVDSCLLHAADLARVPGVGLFGPTRAEEFGFLVGPNIAIQAEEMEEIEPEVVLAALESLLADPGQRSLWEGRGLAKAHG